MPDNANKSDLQGPSKSKSVERNGSEMFRDVFRGSNSQLLGAAAAPFMQFSNPLRLPMRQHVNYQYTPTIAPTQCTDMCEERYKIEVLGPFKSVPPCKSEPESDKFHKLMAKKQKRESRSPKNVLFEFKSQDISGHKFKDLDSVLRSLGEAEEEKKGKVKKKKAQKGKVESKKPRQSVEKEVNNGREDPEERIEARETEETGLEMREIEGITSNICSPGLNKVEVESEEVLNQADIDLEEKLDKAEMEPQTVDEMEALNRQQRSMEAKFHELWNNDRSLIVSKGKEMSKLLSELEDTEEEKAGIEKEVAEIDAKAKELHYRREELVTGIRNKDEN